VDSIAPSEPIRLGMATDPTAWSRLLPDITHLIGSGESRSGDSCRLGQDLADVVRSEDAIARHDDGVQPVGLRNDHPIERVTMMRW
jgi:hypothetical protein